MNLEQRQLDGGGLILELDGEADLAAAPAFQAAVRGIIEQNLPLLLIDFSKVTFVNTPIWAVAVEYYQHTTKSDSKLALVGMQGRVEASFNIVRLGEFIHHFATTDEAIAELG